MAQLQPTLPQVLASHNALQDRSEAMSDQSQQIGEENIALRQAGIDAAQIIGSLNMEAQMRDNTLALEREQTKRTVASTFSADLNDPESMLAYLVKEQQAALKEANERAKYGQRLLDANPLESPLAYFIQRPFAQREFNAALHATDRAKNLDKAIDDINAQVPQTIATQNALQQTFTQEDAARKLAFTAADAAEKSRLLRLTNNTAQLQDLQAVQNIAAKDFEMTVTKYKLIKDAEMQALQLEEMRAKKKQRDLKTVALEEYMDWYNEGAKVYGRKPFTNVDQFAAQLEINEKNIRAVAERGGMNVENGVNNAVIANAPGSAQMTLEAIQGTLPATASRTANYLKTESNFSKQDIMKTGGKLTVETAAQRMNIRTVGGDEVSEDGKTKKKVNGSIVEMKVNAEQDIYGNKVPNIYKAPALSVVETVTPQVKEFVGYNEIIVPAAAAHNGVALGDAVVKQAQLAVAGKTLTPEQAAKAVTSYFKAVALTNNINEGFVRVGLPVQESYSTLVSDPISGSLTKIDLMNDEASIKSNLMKASFLGKFGMKPGGDTSMILTPHFGIR